MTHMHAWLHLTRCCHVDPTIEILYRSNSLILIITARHGFWTSSGYLLVVDWSSPKSTIRILSLGNPLTVFIINQTSCTGRHMSLVRYMTSVDLNASYLLGLDIFSRWILLAAI
jgi:hypothetical protein